MSLVLFVIYQWNTSKGRQDSHVGDGDWTGRVSEGWNSIKKDTVSQTLMSLECLCNFVRCKLSTSCTCAHMNTLTHTHNLIISCK